MIGKQAVSGSVWRICKKSYKGIKITVAYKKNFAKNLIKEHINAGFIRKNKERYVRNLIRGVVFVRAYKKNMLKISYKGVRIEHSYKKTHK